MVGVDPGERFLEIRRVLVCIMNYRTALYNYMNLRAYTN